MIGMGETLWHLSPHRQRAVQLLLGQTKIESTVRYLGIEVDDAIEIAEKIDIYSLPQYLMKQTWSAMRFASPTTKLPRSAPVLVAHHRVPAY